MATGYFVATVSWRSRALVAWSRNARARNVTLIVTINPPPFHKQSKGEEMPLTAIRIVH